MWENKTVTILINCKIELIFSVTLFLIHTNQSVKYVTLTLSKQRKVQQNPKENQPRAKF